jgi:cell division protein FtsZ
MNAAIESARTGTPAQAGTVLRVIGIGGMGAQALGPMRQAGLDGVSFALVHSDAERLSASGLAQTLWLGDAARRGLSTSGDPEAARLLAEAAGERLRELCRGADLVVIVAGLGGGTGSGVAPVLARLAREAGALVLGLVALPFEVEGSRRQRQAQAALRQLKLAADAVICLPNQRTAALVDEHTTLVDTLRIANDLLTEGLRGLWRLITRPGLIKVDFGDLCRVVRGRQAETCFATAEAMGENRGRDLVERLQASPLLDQGRVLAEADAVLVSLVGGPDLTLKDFSLVMEQLRRLAEKAEIIAGAAIDPGFPSRLGVTVVAARRGVSEPDPAAEPGEAAAAFVASHGEPEPPAPEFPVAADPRGVGTGEGAAVERAGSRYLPAPPELTPEQAEGLLGGRGKAGGRRRRKAGGPKQEMLALEVVSKGRFAKSEPTLHRGEDLDTPTYIRRGMALN